MTSKHNRQQKREKAAMAKIEMIGEVGMLRMDGQVWVNTLPDKPVMFTVQKDQVWDWNGKPVKITIVEISPEEIKDAIQKHYQEQDQFIV